MHRSAFTLFWSPGSPPSKFYESRINIVHVGEAHLGPLSTEQSLAVAIILLSKSNSQDYMYLHEWCGGWLPWLLVCKHYYTRLSPTLTIYSLYMHMYIVWAHLHENITTRCAVHAKAGRSRAMHSSMGLGWAWSWVVLKNRERADVHQNIPTRCPYTCTCM